MSVKAKFYCQHVQPGVVGAVYSFQAVFEGSTELQRISENAMFGDATPNGWMDLSMKEAGQFVKDEEYFVHVDAITDVPHRGIAWCAARLAFRADDNPNYPDSLIEFRYTFAGIEGSLKMGVRNPAAIQWLDDHEEVWVSIGLARGRRSDAEIALLEKQLEELIPMWRSGVNNQYARYERERLGIESETVDEYVARSSAPLRRRIAIARGEIVD